MTAQSTACPTNDDDSADLSNNLEQQPLRRTVTGPTAQGMQGCRRMQCIPMHPGKGMPRMPASIGRHPCILPHSPPGVVVLLKRGGVEGSADSRTRLVCVVSSQLNFS
jgi:hypothetical protein